MKQARSELSLLWHVFATSQRVNELLGATMAASPLTPDEYAVYSALFDDGPSPPTVLARRLGMPPTTMSHYVRAMIERGHAERQPSAGDGRSFSLALTLSGVATHRTAAVHFGQANRLFEDALEVDKAFLVGALEEIGRASVIAHGQLIARRARAAG